MIIAEYIQHSAIKYIAKSLFFKITLTIILNKNISFLIIYINIYNVYNINISNIMIIKFKKIQQKNQ